MSKPPLKKALLSLQPLVKITIVSSNSKSEEIHPESINLNLVGQKAFGLAAIPVPWGLPFIVVSKTFLSGYRTCKNETQFVSAWANEIKLFMVVEIPKDFLSCLLLSFLYVFLLLLVVIL